MSATVRAATAPAEPATPSPPSERPGASLKPRCALKIAVVGNRRFGGETTVSPNETAGLMKRGAAEACAAVWKVVLESMTSALEAAVSVPAEHQRTDDRPLPDLLLRDFYGGEAPRLAVLSSLAAGADQIGAETALEAGGPETGVEVELEAVLPFAEAYYPGGHGVPRPEFRPEEAAAVRRLTVEARQVVRLDGRYDDDEERNRAYQQGRDLLLQQADLLVAVYDPLARGRPAGTVETVERALAAGVPVVAVLVGDREARVALYMAPTDRPRGRETEWSGADSLGGDRWRRELSEEVQFLLALPHQLPVPGRRGAAEGQRPKSLAEAVNRLRLVYGEAPPHRLCRGRASRAVFAWWWRSALRVGASFSHPPELAGEAAPPEPARDEITLTPYAAYYDRASELSDTYMQTYRGAFVFAFVFAGLAVAAAVVLMVFSHPDVAEWTREIPGAPEEHWLMQGAPPLLATIALGVGKIVIIVILIVLERVSYQARYQEHATDFRYLAEKLRPMQWLAPVGTVVPTVDLPAHLAPQDPRRGWMPWLVRAVARSTPPVSVPSPGNGPASPREVVLDRDSVRAALERARSQWLQGQVVYHWNHARRMHGLDEGLERLAKVLLWTVLGLAAVAFALKLLYQVHGSLSDAPGELAPIAAQTLGLLRWLSIGEVGQIPFLLGAGAAILPAFIAALAGVMFQSEARRLRTRSEAMYHALRARQRELDEQIASLSLRADEPGGVAWPAAQHLRALSEMMVEETGDWKVLYETHEIHAG